ncbi:MAG: IclR family transcriptional regulator [Bifidobacteriaceae bacterium]|jgi:DNA-binding IclR family transcriptional regulator|nr:IclR family transcriptional regulator [Bifidobacteriaceae bacterium]
MGVEPSSLAPAVTRAVRALDILAEAGGAPVPLAELARRLAAAKSSTLNVCGVLEQAGLIRREAGGYLLGHHTAELGGAYLRGFDIVREFYRLTADSEVLARVLVNLAILVGTDAIYIGRHEGAAPLRVSAGVGDRLPAALTAVGGALLAELSPEEVDGLFRGYPFPRLTDRSTRDLPELRAKLAANRQRGHSIDLGESTPGVIGLGVAVPAARGGQAWAVGVSLIVGPGAEADLPEPRAGIVLEALRGLAERLGNPMAQPA